MKRREFIKYGAYGVTAMAVGSLVTIPQFLKERASRVPENGTLELSMREVLFEMVDKRPVYHRAFADAMSGPHIPGVMLLAREGGMIHITLTNEMDEEHAFAVPGVVDSGPIPPDSRRAFPSLRQRGEPISTSIR